MVQTGTALGPVGCDDRSLTTPHKLRPEARLRNSPWHGLGVFPPRKPAAEDVSFMR
jgi:hypothetical protein